MARFLLVFFFIIPIYKVNSASLNVKSETEKLEYIANVNIHDPHEGVVQPFLHIKAKSIN